jgi:hypothetical protein
MPGSQANATSHLSATLRPVAVDTSRIFYFLCRLIPGREVIVELVASQYADAPPLLYFCVMMSDVKGQTADAPSVSAIGQPAQSTLAAVVVQMFETGLGHNPTATTLTSMSASGLTEPQLAAAFVSSQAFADVNNDGVLVDPGAPASVTVIDNLFQHKLGHPPTKATLAGFNGLTNEQAFLAIVTSDSSDAWQSSVFDTYLTRYSTPISIFLAVLIISVAIAFNLGRALRSANPRIEGED